MYQNIVVWAADVDIAAGWRGDVAAADGDYGGCVAERPRDKIRRVVRDKTVCTSVRTPFVLATQGIGPVHAVNVRVCAERGPRPDDCGVAANQYEKDSQDRSSGQSQPRGRRDEEGDAGGKSRRKPGWAWHEYSGSLRGEHVIRPVESTGPVVVVVGLATVVIGKIEET